MWKCDKVLFQKLRFKTSTLYFYPLKKRLNDSNAFDIISKALEALSLEQITYNRILYLVVKAIYILHDHLPLHTFNYIYFLQKKNYI